MQQQRRPEWPTPCLRSGEYTDGRAGVVLFQRVFGVNFCFQITTQLGEGVKGSSRVLHNLVIPVVPLLCKPVTFSITALWGWPQCTPGSNTFSLHAMHLFSLLRRFRFSDMLSFRQLWHPVNRSPLMECYPRVEPYLSDRAPIACGFCIPSRELMYQSSPRFTR